MLFRSIIGTISINFNAEFAPEVTARISNYTPFFILAGNIILLAVAWYLTPNARKRLTDWAGNQLRANPQEELAAWTEITSLTWRYGIIAVVVAYMVDIVPTSTYYFRIHVTNFDQFIYSLIGGLVSVLTIITDRKSVV